MFPASLSLGPFIKMARKSAFPGTAGIAAVNGAVEALVNPLAVELASIRVNAVSPGFVVTPWWAGMPADARQKFFTQTAQALPVGRIADDIPHAVVLAATNLDTTGTIIDADGGAQLVSMG